MNRVRKDEEEEEELGSVVQRGIVVCHIITTAGRPQEFGPVCVCMCAHCRGQTDRLVSKSS